MKKIILAICIVLLTLLGAIIIVPNYIDWNNFKAEIASKIKDVTGRDLVIDGDIHITILPAPALVVNKVRFANVRGAADKEMARFKSVEVRMAIKPLFQRKVQFETIKLVEPVISLEVLKGGQKNWNFQSQKMK